MDCMRHTGEARKVCNLMRGVFQQASKMMLASTIGCRVRPFEAGCQPCRPAHRHIAGKRVTRTWSARQRIRPKASEDDAARNNRASELGAWEDGVGIHDPDGRWSHDYSMRPEITGNGNGKQHLVLYACHKRHVVCNPAVQLCFLGDVLWRTLLADRSMPTSQGRRFYLHLPALPAMCLPPNRLLPAHPGCRGHAHGGGQMAEPGRGGADSGV